ncbi:MAG TPA: ABC transporter substrate-binding protein [Kofleriaceae bacterium]
MTVRLALVLAALCACTADRGPRFRPAGNPSPRDGGTLRHAALSPVRTLDPTIEYDDVSHTIVHALFDTLVDYGPDGVTLIPRLAQSWTVSPDGLVYTFTLRDGLTFSDGSELVASDIQYGIERAANEAASPFGPFLADVKTMSSSPRELVIELKAPNPAFIYVMTMPFTTAQRRAHVEREGDQLRRHPLGCGPYLLERWDEGQRLVLRKNPRYWDKARAHLDTIELYENVPRDTQFMMFERGELDSAERLSPPDMLWLAQQPAWQPYVHRVTLMTAYGSRMNVRVKPFDDRRVRQALNYALDKAHSVKLLGGAAIASHGLLIPGVPGRDDTLAPYPHDPAKARALLAAAGYPNGFDVDYAIMADEEAERLALSLQADLAAVGVRVHITRLSLATFGPAIGSPHGPAFSKIGWLGDFPDPTSFLDPKFHSHSITEENSTNDTFYANPELDALLDSARAERDPSKRVTLYQRAERLLYDDAPWIWDYHQQMVEVVQPYVAGYAPHPVWLRDYTSAWLDVGPDGPVAK